MSRYPNCYELFSEYRVPVIVLCLFLVFIAGQGVVAVESYVYVAQWGTYGTGDGQLYKPSGIFVDTTGNVYVADHRNSRVQKFSSSGSFLTKFGTYGSGAGQIHYPWGVTVDRSGNIYVTDSGDNCRVQKFDSDGIFITQWGTKGTDDGQFYFPTGVASDSEGNVYVAGFYNQRIQKFSSDGSLLSYWGTEGTGAGQFNHLHGVAIGASDNVYIVDYSNNRIQKFDSDGKYITQWGTYGTGDGQFSGPRGVGVDPSGNVYVADTDNNRIQKFDSDGKYITQWGTYGAGNGQFDLPHGVGADSAGNVYVTDFNNHRIQVFRQVTTVLKTFSTTDAVDPVGVNGQGQQTVHLIEKKLGEDNHWTPIVTLHEPDVTKGSLGINGDIPEENLNHATLHWHVGHGAEDGHLWLRAGGNLYPDELAGKWGYENKWVVLDSCLALRNDTWKNALHGTHGILGFSTVSYVRPSFAEKFIDYAITDRETVYAAFRDACVDEYKDKDVPTGVDQEGYPDETSPRKSMMAKVIFAHNDQVLNDHLPGAGAIAPDANPGNAVMIPLPCTNGKYE
jgi:sugar lactone lactonase YvrE